MLLLALQHPLPLSLCCLSQPFITMEYYNFDEPYSICSYTEHIMYIKWGDFSKLCVHLNFIKVYCKLLGLVYKPSIPQAKLYSSHFNLDSYQHVCVMYEKVFYLLMNEYIQCRVLYIQTVEEVISSDIVGTVEMDGGQLDSCHWTAARLDSLSDLYWWICLHYVIPYWKWVDWQIRLLLLNFSCHIQ